VLSNGTAYTASIDIADASTYEFADVGVLGESIPVKVGNVNLSGNCSPCEFNWSNRWGGTSSVTFPKGNYTISFMAPLHDNHLQGAFRNPYNVSVSLPKEFDVRNPLLAGLSIGANVTRQPDNTTQVIWNKTASFDLRYYDANRESLLYLFGEFWIVIAVALLLPFLMLRRKQ
jgi:hypothetical protein